MDDSSPAAAAAPDEDAALAVLESLLADALGADHALPDAVAAAPGSDAPAERAEALRERSLEALLREEPAAADALAEAGLAAPGGSEPDLRLSLLRLLATAAVHTGDADAVAARVAERAALLRGLGRPRQARLEVQLGASLLREPDGFEAAVLAGVAEEERARAAAEPADTALPDMLLALSAHHAQDGELDAALDAVGEAVAVLRRQREHGVLLPAGAWPSAHLMLARIRLWRGEPAEAEDAATTVLSLPAARAVRASALLVRALAAHEQGRHDAALGFALEAAGRMAAAGLRRGAASAAALVGRVAGTALDRPETAVAAWRLASVHAEKAEAPEAAGLSYWWAHQLVLAGRAEEAEPVLAALVRREAAEGHDVQQARALVDLGHALHDQDRSADAVPLWREAADLFERHGQASDAAHTLLAAGALVNRTGEDPARAEALTLFERAADAARRARDEDPAVLAAALHALGYLRCETGRDDGLDLLDEAIALVREAGTPWQEADYLDTRARALWALSRGDDAVSTALTSADLFTWAGDPDGAAQAELFAAYVVAERGSPEQAATLFRLVCDGTESDLVRLGALTGLHRCLAALGDHAAAARVRADAEDVRRRLGVEG